MELLQLEYFKEVARTEHMTDAAKILHVTQSSLSRTIARLEQDLGAPLFHRIGRRLHLNDFGRAFLQRVDKAMFELNQGRREVAELSGFDYGTVSLGVNTANILPDILREFRRRYPDVQFHVQQLPTDEMQVRLNKGEMDFCLSAPTMAGDEIEGEVLLEDDIYLIVPRSHPVAGRNSIHLVELRGESFVGLRKGYGMRDLMDDYCQIAGFVPKHAFEVDEPATIRALVHEGLGVAFVPGAAMKRSAIEDNVFLAIEPECKRVMGLSWHKDRYLSKAAQEFRQMVIAYFHNARQR